MGGLIVLIAATVGAGLGYVATVILLFALTYYMGHTTVNQAWMMSLALPPNAMKFGEILMIVGAVGGLFLGVWLIRRLWSRPE